ncbi:hypothetical protein CGMCC3_g18040 [Colletotrichum fructicola]|nr:uncharacterized protein CGMCC3_g18040 [Colletotrichum fructicola]KAE9565779.1 hypothetical protein CGMCC3_g18040 [Colletotrichum fructicola]
MAEALGCAAFHSSIGSTEDKASRLEAWRRGDGADGGVIVATNALGLGIDVPDVRLVVHAGMPRRLRDFVQESGRAGRDGQPSRSVVICSRAAVEEEEKEKEAGEAAKDGRAAGGGWEVSTRIYIRGEVCRRIVLDEVMDGRTDRSGCEEGEEACDMCQQRASEVMWADDGGDVQAAVGAMGGTVHVLRDTPERERRAHVGRLPRPRGAGVGVDGAVQEADGGGHVRRTEDGEFQQLFPLRIAAGLVSAMGAVGRGRRAVQGGRGRFMPVPRVDGCDVRRRNNRCRVEGVRGDGEGDA